MKHHLLNQDLSTYNYDLNSVFDLATSFSAPSSIFQASCFFQGEIRHGLRHDPLHWQERRGETGPAVHL